MAEALPRAVRALLEQVTPERVDRLWLFPPLRRGRREQGLVAASGWPGGITPKEGVGDRRILATLAYRAEETGKGVTFEGRFHEEGEAPADRLPRIMAGVVRRTPAGAGEPVMVEGRGEAGRLAEGLAALGVPWSPPREGGDEAREHRVGTGHGERNPQETEVERLT